jgi:hypothetical protein
MVAMNPHLGPSATYRYSSGSGVTMISDDPGALSLPYAEIES